ncbi:MAG: hypothetical protein ACLRYY_07960 [Anaerobutyricum soehngenii]
MIHDYAEYVVGSGIPYRGKISSIISW